MKVFRFEEVPDALWRPAPPDFEDLRRAISVVEEVARDGDEAVRRHAQRFNEVEAGRSLEAGVDEREAAVQALDEPLRDAIGVAAARLTEAAERWMEHVCDMAWPLGDSRIQVWPMPVERAGCYVPGGRYPLPSSALMTVIPARTAGVEQVIVCSPKAAPVTIAAAHLAGADRVFRIGGMHAIAALAVGTETIPRCDVVVGPGNRYVQAAKAAVFGRVGVDLIAGATEVVIVADRSADPDLVAADLLAQAEHDAEARPILIALDPALAERVPERVEARLAALPTAETARNAIERAGCVIVTENWVQAAEIVNRLAPEHLEVAVAEPEVFLAECRHFGCAFVGPASFEVLGDYVLGTNHVLPTGGAARFTAGLSVLSFLRFPCVARTGPSDLPHLARAAASLARAEGLHAHAEAALARLRSAAPPH